MKKSVLFLIGFSMILMSCENVQEKSEQFKKEFDIASRTISLMMQNVLPMMHKPIMKGLVILTKISMKNVLLISKSYWQQRNLISNGVKLAL